MDQATTLAPLSSAAAKEEVLGQIKLAKENGATVVYGDEPIDHPGNFVMPTVLINVTKRKSNLQSRNLWSSCFYL